MWMRLPSIAQRPRPLAGRRWGVWEYMRKSGRTRIMPIARPFAARGEARAARLLLQWAADPLPLQPTAVPKNSCALTVAGNAPGLQTPP